MCLQRHACKGFAPFKNFFGRLSGNTFVFPFASCIQFVFTFILTRACGAVRVGCERVGGGAVRGRCGAYLRACVGGCTCLGAHRKTPKIWRRAEELHPPPAEKKSFPPRGSPRQTAI